MTLLYDSEITPDTFAEKAIKASLNTANPAFANLSYYKKISMRFPLELQVAIMLYQLQVVHLHYQELD